LLVDKVQGNSRRAWADVVGDILVAQATSVPP
jgi:hypothetical protein